MQERYIKGETSAKLREAFIETHLVPLSKRVFAARRDVQSVVLAVAQYWADEADDAVHLRIIPCVVPDPSWPSCLQNNPYVLVEEYFGNTYEMLSEDADDLVGWQAREDLPTLDDNTSAITAFASCCGEEGSQEDPMSIAYEPYAVARRAQTGVEIEIVGKVQRPEWEDRVVDEDD